MITTYSKFREGLKSYLDEVVESHSPLFVNRTKGDSIVVLSLADYDSIMETFYLLKSPRNAERLLRAVNQYNQGQAQVKNLIEE